MKMHWKFGTMNKFCSLTILNFLWTFLVLIFGGRIKEAEEKFVMPPLRITTWSQGDEERKIQPAASHPQEVGKIKMGNV